MGAYLERLKKINPSLPPTDKTDKADKTAMSAESVAHEKVESPLSPTDKTDKADKTAMADESVAHEKVESPLSPTDKTDKADKTAMADESVAHEKVESPLPPTDKTDKSRLEGPFVGSVSFVSSREGEKFLQVAPSTPTPSVSFVSASLRESVDFSALETAALAILRELYQQHRQRLVDGGHSPQGARVRGDTYRAALLARAIPLEAAIALRQAKRVRSEGLYWSLVDEVKL